MRSFSTFSKDNNDLNHKVNSKNQERFFNPIMQAKLNINQPNDVYEQEADAMADKVMRMPDNENVQQPFFRPAISSLQRKCEHCEEEEKKMQRKEMNNEEKTTDKRLENYVGNLNSSGQSLSNELRNFYEPRLGYDLRDVKVHTDNVAAKSAQSINALAYTSGNNIVFNNGQYQPETDTGKKLLAHELTHVVQQHHTSKNIQKAPAKNTFIDAAAWKDAAGATVALDAYTALPEADRRAAVAGSYKLDLVQILRNLSPADKIGKYVNQIREITRWVEEDETNASSGMTDDKIAAEQAKFMQKQAEDAAKAAAALKAPKGPPPPAPTAAEIEVERKKQVADTSISTPTVSGWDALPPADKANWTTRGNAAIAKVVTYASGKYPELSLTALKFRLAFKDIESRGVNVLAFAEPDGVGSVRAAAGFSFTTAVELNPAYVIDVVVHELFGHEEYGPYGTEYHLKLYDIAASKIPGYVQPAAGTPDRTREIDAYAYQETEIFAVLRSMAYHTSPVPADVGKVPNLDTQALVTWHVSLMKQQWAPTLIVSILRGLRWRLLIDPHITGSALAVFDKAVRTNFAPATAALVTAK